MVSKNSKVTLNFNVDSHVANAHIVTGLPQRKGVNPNACQLYTEIKYVKDVFCVGHLPSVNRVTNAQHAVLDPPVGARLQQCWEKWETLGSSPKVVKILREGYTLPFPLDKVTDCNKQLPQSNQTVLPFRGTVSADKQKCSRTGGKSKLTGVLQLAIFGTQTQQPVETDSRPEHLEHLFEHRVVHTNSQSVQEVHAFSPPGSVLPVQSPSLWPVHSPHGVHSGDQRGQTHQKGIRIHQYLDDWLVRASTHDTCLQHTQTHHTVPGARVAGEQGKIRTGPTAGLQLCRLPVRPEGGQGQTNRGTLADLDRQDQINTVGSGMPGPEIYVPHRATHSNRKTSPLRATTHETHTVALEKQLEGPRITGKGDTGSQVPPPPSMVVAGGKQCTTRSTITPSKTCSADLYRRIKRRVGRSLGRPHCKRNLVPSREQVTQNHLELKAVFLALKEFRTLVCNKTVLIATDNTTVVAYINKEGGMKSGSLCALLWQILSWFTRQQVTLRARHIPSRLNVIADKLSRLGQTIQTEWSLHPAVFQAVCSRWHQPQVDLFAIRFNNKLPQFVSPVPDPQAWAVDALSLSWEDLDPYAFPPAAILGKVVEKLQDYPCNRIILIAPGWPNMPWFWDLVAMSSQIPLCLPSLPNLVSQPFNQVLHRNLSNLNLHAWLLEPQQSRSKASLRQ